MGWRVMRPRLRQVVIQVACGDATRDSLPEDIVGKMARRKWKNPKTGWSATGNMSFATDNTGGVVGERKIKLGREERDEGRWEAGVAMRNKNNSPDSPQNWNTQLTARAAGVLVAAGQGTTGPGRPPGGPLSMRIGAHCAQPWKAGSIWTSFANKYPSNRCYSHHFSCNHNNAAQSERAA